MSELVGPTDFTVLCWARSLAYEGFVWFDEPCDVPMADDLGLCAYHRKQIVPKKLLDA